MGKNSRAKKPKSEKVYTLGEKQLERIKRDVADDVTKRAMLLVACGMIDELESIPEVSERMPEDFIDRFSKRITRYSSNLDAHLFRLRDLAESIYKQTGVDWRSW